MKACGIIPARLESKRLPGKAVIDIEGKPMIQRVFERACNAELLDEVYIATDSDEIFEIVKGFSDNCIMTSPHHQTGTDRVAEAAEILKPEIVINIQGDEPLIEGEVIDAVVEPLINENLEMTTAAVKWDEDSISNPNFCKVVVDNDNNALYFSRAVIPYYRNSRDTESFYKHIGIYGFTTEFLSIFAKLPRTRLEMTEGLEMLRALEHGYGIRVVVVDYKSIGVDTEYELEIVRSALRK